MNNPPPSVNSLLTNIKSTVELLVQFRGDSLTTKYGAIERLRLAILAILSHGLKQNTQDIYEQLWQLIVRLNANSQRYIHLLQDIYHKENIRQSVEQWIDQSVISQCLSQQLSCAEHDHDLLEQYYYPHAFTRILPFYQAFLICIRTVEYSDPSLLINIDPKLSIVGFYPIPSINDATNQSNISPSSIVASNGKSKDDTQQKLRSLGQQRILHRRIHSDPIFSIPKDSISANRSRVASPSPLDQSIYDENVAQPQYNIPNISYFQSDEYDSYGSSYGSRGDIFDQNKQTKITLGKATDSKSPNRQSISSEITIIDEPTNALYTNRLSTIMNNDETVLSVGSTSPMDRSITMSATDYPTRTSRLPHSSLLWPRKGQTLDNYIRECDLKTRTDVEKENAHFYFSEAIISAIEQIKFTQQCNKYFGQSWSSSIANIISPCETTHTSSSVSSSSPPTQQYIPCNSKLLSNSETKNLITQQPDEMTESTTDSNEPPNNFDWSIRSSILSLNLQESSAEAIALALMETWKNLKVPTAPQLFWMIPHDEDLPQELLPLPDGISIDPSEDYLSNEDGQRILCRGNSQWAPPREQLIFHIHQPPDRDSQLKKQGYLCAGCGRHVEKGFAYRYRYCEYTGKYFCRSCHSDKKSFLPSYVIIKWDFSSKHSVSNFAFDYLNRIYSEPTFNVNDLNPKLFEKNKQLRAIDELRWSLFYLRHYILTCRFAEEKNYPQILQKLPSYMYSDPYSYSIQDLFKAKSGDLIKVLEPIVLNLRKHALNCALCYAKGFICEICKNEKSIIFPFDLDVTSVCQVCQSCFHFQCHVNKKYHCPKCQRNKSRNNLTSSNRSNTPTNIQQEDDIVA
ncbi:unnamed protein product [Rotaria magnacalcarata]|uniref:RUN domain-containing protein n=1 Tax=Rotaria magnacalcarata TaxID=392030 RepID=A0A819LNJ9_9BILA|nr:unnamed protein product [Rotaria magnacalcarata]CAF3963782.1 unnamed protein product [Rotaria magnacalcarata]